MSTTNETSKQTPEQRQRMPASLLTKPVSEQIIDRFRTEAHKSGAKT